MLWSNIICASLVHKYYSEMAFVESDEFIRKVLAATEKNNAVIIEQT